MTTILHTADAHLDRAYSGVGMTAAMAAMRRQELRDGLRRFIDLALELRADVVTIGGDLYEHERSTLDTGNFIRQQFERVASTPVLVSPGNHDPVLPDSLWRRVEWSGNVTVFDEPFFRPARIGDGLTVWGAGHNAPDLRQNLLDGFRVPDTGRHVLLFHGSDLTSVPEGKRVHCGFRPDDIERTGAEFALLGHYHGGRVHERFAYPGTPEALDFSESGQHHVLRVDIDSALRAELLPFGNVRYETHTVDVSDATTSDDLRNAIIGFASGSAIVRLVLKGDLSSDVDLDVGALYNATVEQFRYLDLIDRTQPAWDLDELAEESTTKGAFVRLMRQEIARLPDDRSEAARLALTMGLHAFERKEVHVP